MKISLRDIVASAEALQSLSRQPLTARAAFTCARMLQVINTELESYDKARLAACQKYGTLDRATNNYIFENGTQADFVAEMEALLQTEIELSITPLPLKIIEDAKLTPTETMRLLWLITE